MKELLDQVYGAMDGSDVAEACADRHGIKSAAVLTVYDDETADLIASLLEPRIAGKTVIDVGGGIGLLALHLGLVAKRVYCIEANPMWSWVFATSLLRQKPKNVSFLFGAADEFVGEIKADVALLCTHSDVAGMRSIASRFAPEVIDVYGELIAANPDAFDCLARKLRSIV